MTTIYPNLFTMIVGEPGDRKSTAIKMVRDFCEEAGYLEFAFDAGSKESYFESLSKKADDIKLDVDLEIGGAWEPPANETHSFICQDEFDVFIGPNNIGFISVLGDLWDRKKDFHQETKKGGILTIRNPFITILGGTTPETFSTTFPATILGRGFLSRLLLIPCKGLERKIALPERPPQEELDFITSYLRSLLEFQPRELDFSNKAKKIFIEIYEKWKSPFDSRFAGYASRRHIHLLKLAIIFSILNSKFTIDEETLLEAHSFLVHTESLMPNVIGELGKGPHSLVMSEIMNTLDKRPQGLSTVELYKLVHRNVRSLDEVNHILNLLKAADRVKVTPKGANVSIPNEIKIQDEIKPFVDPSLIKKII